MPRGEGNYDRGRLTVIDMICMNPLALCACCIFQESAYCLPHERLAKAELDQQAVAA